MAKTDRREYQHEYRQRNRDKDELWRYNRAKRLVILYEAQHPDAAQQFFAREAAAASGTPLEGRPRKRPITTR